MIALTIAARHGSSIRHVVSLASRASGPALLGMPNVDNLANDSSAFDLNLLVGASFPQGARDPGEAEACNMSLHHMLRGESDEDLVTSPCIGIQCGIVGRVPLV